MTSALTTCKQGDNKVISGRWVEAGMRAGWGTGAGTGAGAGEQTQAACARAREGKDTKAEQGWLRDTQWRCSTRGGSCDVKRDISVAGRGRGMRQHNTIKKYKQTQNMANIKLFMYIKLYA